MEAIKLNILSIVLDGFPFIQRQLPIFESSGLDWDWFIAEGVASNTACTHWCKSIPPRLSTDGTAEYLTRISSDPRIHLMRRQLWDGKIAMCNACISQIHSDSVTIQIDADEIYTPDQLRKIVSLFEQDPKLDQMNFYCRYFVGPDIILNLDNEIRHNTHEWRRAWRWRRGFRFTAHEPPTVSPKPVKVMAAQETYKHGLVFNHYAYATEPQVKFKELFYGYKNAVDAWKRLQANKRWPVKARMFLPWTNPFSIAEKISIAKP